MYHKTKSISEPPCSNTGVTLTPEPFPPIELGIDWIAGTFPTTAIGQARKLLETTFEQNFPEEFFGSQWYAKVYQIPKGVRLSTDPRGDGKTKSYIGISSTALTSLTAQQQYDLMLELQALDFACSRIDIKLDDYSKTLTPTLVYQAIERGNYTGFQQKVYRRWLESGTSNLKSQTLEIGRRGSSGSGKFIRVYTKWVQTMLDETPIDSNRLEIEFTENKSSQVFEFLLTVDISNWAELMLNLVTGAVDFLDRVEDTEYGHIVNPASRCSRLEWWHKVVGDITKIKLSTVRKVTTIAKSFRWVRKQVAPTLAMLFDYISYTSNEEQPDLDVMAFFYELWFNGSERFNDNHKALLAPYLIN